MGHGMRGRASVTGSSCRRTGAYNETRAAIASFQWSWRLLLATGDARYADHMERILYNGFASATATGGTRFFYVNPRLISGKVGSGVPWRRQTGATGRWCNTPASSIPSGWF